MEEGERMMADFERGTFYPNTVCGSISQLATKWHTGVDCRCRLVPAQYVIRGCYEVLRGGDDVMHACMRHGRGLSLGFIPTLTNLAVTPTSVLPLHTMSSLQNARILDDEDPQHGEGQ